MFQELNLSCIPKTVFLQYNSTNPVYTFVFLILILSVCFGKLGTNVLPKSVEVEKR